MLPVKSQKQLILLVEDSSWKCFHNDKKTKFFSRNDEL